MLKGIIKIIILDKSIPNKNKNIFKKVINKRLFTLKDNLRLFKPINNRIIMRNMTNILTVAPHRLI